jgi:holo-[acyl-carrier protein] synthase
MIVGLGIDVVEVARIARVLASPSAERFVARVFTPGEGAYCAPRRDGAMHYAVRFAAKEAASKALGVPAGIRFLDVEVTRAEGAPRLVLAGVAEERARALGVTDVHLSLTHDAGVAAAVVVLERREGRP